MDANELDYGYSHLDQDVDCNDYLDINANPHAELDDHLDLQRYRYAHVDTEPDRDGVY